MTSEQEAMTVETTLTPAAEVSSRVFQASNPFPKNNVNTPPHLAQVAKIQDLSNDEHHPRQTKRDITA